jgi:probable HAF family extracellular repeat protein
MKPIKTYIAIFVIAVFASQSSKAQIRYTVTDLGVLPGGTATSANAINNRGQVTGGSNLSVSTTHAFLYSNGHMQDIGTLGGDFSVGISINDHGQIAGTSTTIPNIGQNDIRAFFYSAGTFQNLGVLGLAVDSNGNAVNNHGIVVGEVFYNPPNLPNPPSGSDAFIWNGGGQLQNLHAGIGSIALGINDQTEVVGYSNDLVGPKAFLWENGKILQLPTLGSGNGVAQAINNRGHVVGGSTFANSNIEHAFLYAEGRIRALDSNSSVYSFAAAINSYDQVVGNFETVADRNAGTGAVYACIFVSGHAIDLNGFLRRNSGWVLTGAVGINDVGQIVGNGTHNGLSRAFLMTPIR